MKHKNHAKYMRDLALKCVVYIHKHATKRDPDSNGDIIEVLAWILAIMGQAHEWAREEEGGEPISREDFITDVCNLGKMLAGVKDPESVLEDMQRG